jgi:hypothetical protein
MMITRRFIRFPLSFHQAKQSNDAPVRHWPICRPTDAPILSVTQPQRDPHRREVARAGFDFRARLDEISLGFQRDLGRPVLRAKIFRLTRRANQRYQLARLTRQEGRLAIVTNARWDAVDA